MILILVAIAAFYGGYLMATRGWRYTHIFSSPTPLSEINPFVQEEDSPLKNIKTNPF